MSTEEFILIRNKSNLTQNKFAKLIGVSLRTVQNWESGRKIPKSKFELLRKISEKNEFENIDLNEESSDDENMLKNRIKDLCKSEGIGVAAFERSIGRSNGYVNSIKKNIGLEKILQIIEVYPNVNLNWLTTGEGEMYKTDFVNEPGFVYHPSDLESLYNEDEIETFVNSNGNKFYIYANNTIKIEVPIMTEPAYAGYIETLTDGGVVNLNELPKTTFKVDRIGKGNYLAFTTKNNSMWNGGGFDTPSGAEVLGREISKHLWSNGFRKTDYGFILLTKNGIYHKDVKNYDPERGILVLESRNPEEKDFELPIIEVNKVFNVIKRAF